MGNLVKQTVNSVVFMDNMSTEDDIRCITLEIDCEGAGRFFRLSTEKKGSDIYFSTPDDFRLIYETALALWQQGDIFAPGDTLHDMGSDGERLPTLSALIPEIALTPENMNRLIEQRDFLLREMRRIDDDPGNSGHIASEAVSAVCANEIGSTLNES
jgi:hypothetical protein